MMQQACQFRYNLSVTDIIASPSIASELLHLMASLRRALRRRTGRLGGIEDLTDAQRELVRLVRVNPEIRIGQAAVELRLAPNTVSTLAGSLIASKWLERSPDPDDARSGRLRLSPSGNASVAEWRDKRTTILEETLQNLNPEERDAIERAMPALKTLLSKLEADE
jgi:DNA-binding MarR family transcriptional regulator